MKFVYRDEHFVFIDDEKEYLLPNEDIARLIARPGTRVLRYIDTDTIKSMPLKSTIGEIEGFELFQHHDNNAT